MPEPTCIAELRRRLQRHGLPRRRLERILRETVEHWDDSRAAALEEGMAESEAAARADRMLGEPAVLAKSFTAQMRRRSWLGRHPVLAFTLLPTVLVLLAFALLGLPLTLADSVAGFSERASLHTPVGLVFVSGFVWTLYVCGTAFAPVVLSGWAWRSGLGRRFAVVLCSGCALASAVRFLHVDLAKRLVAFGVRWPTFSAQTGAMALLHLMIAVAFLLLTRRAARAGPLHSEPEPIKVHEN